MFATVPEWFRQGTNGRGAAFATSLLMRLQDERLDMANFYTADTSAWSMFGTFGVRTPVYHAFVAFNEVAKRPARAACTVAAEGGGTSAAVAGLAEDGRSAVVLVTTFEAAAGRRDFRIAGLPWAAEARVEALLVDGDHALEPVLPHVSQAADGVTIGVDLPADAVCLVRLVRPCAE